MSIVRVLDFETTGDAPPAEVCEVGICDLDLATLDVDDPISWLCRVKTMPSVVRAVHHITLAECESFPPFDPVTIMQTPCTAIAAHNSKFETAFYTPTVPIICTYKAALRVWPHAPGHSNGVLACSLEDTDIIHPDHALGQPSHRAGPDAYLTALILRALLETGATGREMGAWTKEPPVLPTCPLGKFRGKPWPDVEAGFLAWMLKTPDMDPDLQWNARRELDRRAGNHT